MDFSELAKSRFSCRKFKNIPVENEKIGKILDVAIAAPTAKNVQPFKIWVASSEDAIAKIKTITPAHFDAKLFFIVGGNSEQAFTRPYDNRNFEDVDATIVGTHIMLATYSLGLGSTWVGFFDEPELKKLFSEMMNYDIVGLFPTGYPADDAAPTERHFQRKTTSELVSFI